MKTKTIIIIIIVIIVIVLVFHLSKNDKPDTDKDLETKIIYVKETGEIVSKPPSATTAPITVTTKGFNIGDDLYVLADGTNYYSSENVGVSTLIGKMNKGQLAGKYLTSPAGIIKTSANIYRYGFPVGSQDRYFMPGTLYKK